MTAPSSPDQEWMRQLNAAVNKMWRDIAPKQPNWRWFGPGGALTNKPADVYFWTTEKANHNGKPRYLSGVYKWNPKLGRHGGWDFTKTVGHAKRTDAKARALKLYEASKAAKA